MRSHTTTAAALAKKLVAAEKKPNKSGEKSAGKISEPAGKKKEVPNG